MRFVILVLFAIIPLTLIFAQKALKSLYYFEEVIFPTKNINSNAGKNILLVNGAPGAFGGAEIYTLMLYKNLIDRKYNVKILVAKNSDLESRLKEEKISYFAFNKFRILKNNFQPGLYPAMYKICKQHKIDIIHCNIHRETTAAKKVRQKLGVKVVLTCHIPQKLNPKHLKNLDGFVGVNSKIASVGKNKELSIKESAFIAPFFDEKKFENFQPCNNKKDFFKNSFNIDLKEIPVLCMVANMPTSTNHKNHPLLLKAVHKLIYEQKKPVQLILAGHGNGMEALKQQCKELNIEKYMHFVGFTNKIPEILFHSDIKILSSKQEAFGIVLLEAGLLKKPIIGAANTGMVDIIKHEQTGLLFENNNVDSLVEQIERLLNNPDFAKQLGENAYHFVKENFSTQSSMKKLEQFYKKVLDNKV